MDYLPTAFALFCLAASTFLVWAAKGWADEARAAVFDLRKLHGRIAAFELGLQEHTIQLKRLNGRMYAQRRDRSPSLLDEEVDPDQAAAAARLAANGIDMDPELEAELRLQNAPPVRPGG